MFSQSTHPLKDEGDTIKDVTYRVQYGGDEVVKAKDGAGSATLSMAYAGAEFATKLISAIKGEKGVVEPTFVYLPGVTGGDAISKATGVEFFSTPVELGVSYISQKLNSSTTR